jgi:hypothetical protein
MLYHSDEWVGPKTYRRRFEQNRGGAGDKEGRTCLAKDGEFALLPASFVDVSLRRHCEPELMENDGKMMHSVSCPQSVSQGCR